MGKHRLRVRINLDDLYLQADHISMNYGEKYPWSSSAMSQVVVSKRFGEASLDVVPQKRQVFSLENTFEGISE